MVELDPVDGEEPSRADPRQGIQSVEIAMTVLQAIEAGRGPMSLTQIAQCCGMGASKAHRYLVSLCRVGLAVQSQRSGLYDLGPAMRRIGIESLRRMDEVGLASEYLPGLRDRTSHAVNLAVWGEAGPVVVRWDYGAHALPITVRVGATLPLLTSSVGLVYLTHLPETMTRPVLDAEIAGRSVKAPDEKWFDDVRRKVREQGLAVTSGGVIPGIMSIAAPVFSPGDTIPLVVAVAMPERLADDATVALVERELARTVEAISVDLGTTAAASPA
ncbi:IclR family transcriptional regulator [Amycolatopsis pithecellobii]|uniref:Helix-turn-helix domain-containing protein n=1 Tax=Amycolatopsis pithecellobii TaxID=664692 RepID=A0A6N7ZAZ7_9PSEU|nr:IclR family transcriptional regulator [Amycolatopsis pithecellobii]MTD58932.1 helix-turn-helix domain-containing protein [Amycolatopsis pithecellobii]